MTAKQRKFQADWRRRNPNYHRNWMRRQRSERRMGLQRNIPVSVGLKHRERRSWRSVVREYLGL